MKTKIFCDIAELKVIKKFNKKTIVKGFTTNPSLMRKAGAKNYTLYSKNILRICKNKPVSLEVFADEFNEIKKQAKIINAWAKNVYVKIPVVNSKGKFMGKAIKELNNQNIKLNITAVYNAKQTKKILSTINKKSKVIISIFAGRISDTFRSPSILVKQCTNIFKKFKKAETLWASTREIYNIVEAEKAKCDIITISPSILAKYNLKHYSIKKLNLETVRMFRSDALKANLKLK